MTSTGPLRMLTQLFDALPIGLVVLDRAGRVVVYNRAEQELAGRSRDSVIMSDFFVEVAPCMNVRELGEAFRERIGVQAFDVSVEMSFPFPHLERPRDVSVRMHSMDVDAEPYCFMLVEDTSLRRSVDRMREKLQSLLVHDLKNPLTAISMNLELLEGLASVRDTPDALESIADALDATKRLGRMTVNLLDISRLETASMPLRRTRTDLSSLFARVRTDNLAAARAHGARIHLAPGADFDAHIDEDLVARAIDNLVENSIRHAKNVTLAASLEPAAVTIRVSDDGPGVPAELRERLFDRYVQVQGSQAARGHNRGLGLTFVKLVAQQHGGDVDVACPPGGGTIFTLRLALT